MTNLSKTLCDICRIPYTKVEDNCRVYDSEGELCEQYVYKLDFEQPENFMKLFKLITTLDDFVFRTGNFYLPSVPTHRQDTTLIAGNETYYSSCSNPIQAFIGCVIRCCMFNKDVVDFIRESEWKYE